MRRNFAGTVKREKSSTFRILVNNREVDLPVLEFSGMIGANLHPHGQFWTTPRFR